MTTPTEEERKAAALREVELQFAQLCPGPMPGEAVVGRVYQSIGMKTQADLTRTEKRLEEAEGDAKRMADAIQAFRNLPLKHFGRLRETKEYGELCYSWEQFSDRLNPPAEGE